MAAVFVCFRVLVAGAPLRERLTRRSGPRGASGAGIETWAPRADNPTPDADQMDGYSFSAPRPLASSIDSDT